MTKHPNWGSVTVALGVAALRRAIVQLGGTWKFAYAYPVAVSMIVVVTIVITLLSVRRAFLGGIWLRAATDNSSR